MTQQGPPSSAAGGPPPPRRHGRGDRRAHSAPPPPGRYWETIPDDDEDAPPWAGPPVPPRPSRRPPPPDEPRAAPGAGGPAAPPRAFGTPAGQPEAGRADTPGGRRRSAAAARRTQRARAKVYIWAAAAIAVIVIAIATVFGLTRGHAARPSSGGLVTTFQPGEFQRVPATCSSVSPTTLDAYLPGKRTQVVPQSVDGPLESLCGWTVDTRAFSRNLEVTSMAYKPSGLATGNGSATFAARDAYAAAMKSKQHPARDTHLPRAAVTPLAGLADSAFAATQVVRTGGQVTDEVTVVARERNVLITAILEGVVSERHHRLRPFSEAALQTGATAVVRDMISHLH